MDVPMELSRILITELGDQQVIFLREKGGERTFPIMIGINEALAIDRRLKNIPTPRPMTHDLLASVIESLGGKLEKIVIDDIRMLMPEDDHQTFIATLHIRQNDTMIRVDSRPSDAIALGVAFSTPIYVADHVLGAVLSNEPNSREARINLLRKRLFVLGKRIQEFTERLASDEFLAQAPAELVQEHRKHLNEMRSEYDAIDKVLKKLG